MHVHTKTMPLFPQLNISFYFLNRQYIGTLVVVIILEIVAGILGFVYLKSVVRLWFNACVHVLYFNRQTTVELRTYLAAAKRHR